MAESSTGDRMTSDEKRSLLRASVIGFTAGGGLFGLIAVYMNWQIGDPALSNPGPTLVLVVIGGTVAGLVAPMFRRRRRRAKG